MCEPVQFVSLVLSFARSLALSVQQTNTQICTTHTHDTWHVTDRYVKNAVAMPFRNQSDVLKWKFREKFPSDVHVQFPCKLCCSIALSANGVLFVCVLECMLLVCSVQTLLFFRFFFSIHWPGQWLKVSSGADQVKSSQVSFYLYLSSCLHVCITICIFRFAAIWTHAHMDYNGFQKNEHHVFQTIFYSFGQRLQFHIRMHWERHKANWNLCAMRTLWSRNSRSGTFGRVIAVFSDFFFSSLAVFFFSCLFILQHNCGLNTISMRHRNEI